MKVPERIISDYVVNWCKQKTISFLEGCKDLTLQQQQCYNRVIAFIGEKNS